MSATSVRFRTGTGGVSVIITVKSNKFCCKIFVVVINYNYFGIRTKAKIPDTILEIRPNFAESVPNLKGSIQMP